MVPVPQIPYQAIGLAVALFLGVWAFIEAETVRGRALIVSAAVFLLLFRMAWPGRVGAVVSLVGWMIFGLGCLIFLRLRGYRIR